MQVELKIKRYNPETDTKPHTDLAALEPVRQSLAWSGGFLVANRDLITAAGGLDDSLFEMDICLLDHVIVGANGWVSLRDRGVAFDRPLGWR